MAMRTWNLAIACLATMSLQSNAAMPIVQLKSGNNVAPKSQAIKYTLEDLAENPELIDQLNLNDEQRRQLFEQIIINAEEKRQSGADDSDNNQGLVHQVQFFGGIFDGFTQQPSPPPRPMYPNYSPQQFRDEGQNYSGQNCPITGKRAKMPTPPAEPDVVFAADDMKNPDDWKVKNFDLVVVINKAEYGQDMRVWRRLKSDDKLLTLIKDGRTSGWKVSTGREHAEVSVCDAQELGIGVDPSHAPKNSYWSQTPTGYYIPDILHIDHVSSDWEGSAMDHAVFFDSRRGIATHKVPDGQEGRLGSRASGACVRMYQNQARDLFWMVRSTGGPVSREELAQNEFPHCYKKDQLPEVTQACIARGKQRRLTLNFANEYELAKVSGLTPNADWQQVPQITREGKCKFAGADEKSFIVDDCSKEGVLTRKAYKTLYVVENRFIEKPVPVAKKPKAPAVSTTAPKTKKVSSSAAAVR